MENRLERYAKPQGMDEWGEDAISRCRSNVDDVMVTVVCITYNQEPFISEALESFISQKTDFKFKVFVGDDCSSDNTPRIIKEYAERYPDIIVPFLRASNMGGLGKRNLIDLCNRVDSPYLAMCEGDDYWIDEYKLQKQFDYMEAHKDCRVCIAKTKIVAPENWHLRSWYKPTDQNELIIPDSVPGYKSKEEYSPAEIIKTNIAHTSTYFFRWDSSLVIPDWYFEGKIGDTSLLLLQLGETKLALLPDVVSVYRINEGSVFYNEDRESHFIQTRLDLIQFLSGIYDYASVHYDQYPLAAIKNRITVEVANYLQTAIRRGDDRLVGLFFTQYPFASRCFLEQAIPDFWDEKSVAGTFGWSDYKLYVRNKAFRKRVKPLLKTYSKVKKIVGRIRKKKSSILAFIRYWKNSFTKKDDTLWVFSGFNKRAYSDNTKYLFEYVVENHPEIHAVWVTTNRNVYIELTFKGLPVEMMNSPEGRKIVSHAKVGFIDHWRVSDLDARFGLNRGLNIVQLWHGVGLKSITDLTNNSDIPGVQFSDDIIPSKNDSLLSKINKRLKYFIFAPRRELFEEYFMLVCPGEERVKQIADQWNIPHEACCFSGHPRNINLYTISPCSDPIKILYAPTFRWSARGETEMIRLLLDSSDAIQSFLTERNAELTVRLHPHTWRNYRHELIRMAQNHDRVVIDEGGDIYQSLPEYSLLISDYSSIAYDFILLDRPVVFFAFDEDDFVSREVNLNYDYSQYSPGFHTRTWSDTLKKIGLYLDDPNIHHEWRDSVRCEFYDLSVNDEFNSERIVGEVKNRLGILQ